MTYRNNDILKGDRPQSGVASADTVVSDEFECPADVMTHGIMIMAKASAYTAGAGVSLVLQHGFFDRANVATWNDVHATLGQVTVSGTGLATLRLHPGVAAEAAALPLRSSLRVVARLGAGSALTLTDLQAFADNLTRPSAHMERGV